MAVLGLRFCARAFSSCGKRGPLFIAVCGPLTIVASLVAGHRLQTRRLSNCGSRAQLFRGMWDLPRPGLEPVSPALAGRFSTTAPPGKPENSVLKDCFKNKMLPFAAPWMGLGGIMLSEMSDGERQILYDITCMWKLKNGTSECVEQNRNRFLTDTENKVVRTSGE